jgi:hypothetical protein
VSEEQVYGQRLIGVPALALPGRAVKKYPWPSQCSSQCATSQSAFEREASQLPACARIVRLTS